MTIHKFNQHVSECTTLPEGLAASLKKAVTIDDIRNILAAVIETEYNSECDWLYSLTQSIDTIIEKQSRDLVHNRTLGATLQYTSKYKNTVVASFGYMVDGVVFVFTKVKVQYRRAVFVKRMYVPQTNKLVKVESTESEFAEQHFLCSKLSSRKYFTGKMQGCS